VAEKKTLSSLARSGSSTLLLAFFIFSISRPFLVHRLQQPEQQQIRSHHERDSFSMSMPSTFRRLNDLHILSNGKHIQFLTFWHLVGGMALDFPAIIWALSERCRSQHDERPQQSFLFRPISFISELKGERESERKF
jgi:hypothetical protein